MIVNLKILSQSKKVLDVEITERLITIPTHELSYVRRVTPAEYNVMKMRLQLLKDANLCFDMDRKLGFFEGLITKMVKETS